MKVSRNVVPVKDLLPKRRTGKSLTYILTTFYPGLAFSKLDLTVFTCQTNQPKHGIKSHLLHHIGREKTQLVTKTISPMGVKRASLAILILTPILSHLLHHIQSYFFSTLLHTCINRVAMATLLYHVSEIPEFRI